MSWAAGTYGSGRGRYSRIYVVRKMLVMTRMNSPDHFSVMKSGRSLDIKQQSSIFLPYLKQVLTFHDYVLSLLFWFCNPSSSSSILIITSVLNFLGLTSGYLLTIDFHSRIVSIRSYVMHEPKASALHNPRPLFQRWKVSSPQSMLQLCRLDNL